MKLSDKNMRILLVGLIIVMVGIYFLVPHKSYKKKKTNLENNIANLQNTYSLLAADLGKEEEYENGIAIEKKRAESFEAILPSDLPQEYIIYYLRDIEKEIGVKFPNINLGPVTTVSTINEGTPEQQNAISVSITTSTVIGYDQLKNLLRYLYTAPYGLSKNNRIVMNGINLTRVDDTSLNAAVNLTFYGLQAEGRAPVTVDLGDFEIEKDNVFNSINGINVVDGKETSQSKLIDPVEDFVMTLKPTSADSMAFSLGKVGEYDTKSYIYSDENKVVNTTVEFYKEGEKYYYRYKVGNNSYPKNYNTGVEFIPGDAIEILVLSSKRLGSNDLSGANATFINKTDLPVNVIYSNEDTDKPRLNIVKVEGNVNIR